MARILPPALPVHTRPINKELLNELNAHGYMPAMSRIFAARDILTAKEVTQAGKQLLQWRDMKGAVPAVEILCEALATGQKIVVVADYDSDGATSCAIAVRALKSFGGQVSFAVPNRFIHGYGLTSSVVEQVWNTSHPELIITVDNGISSHDGIKTAHKYGIKVLVTDHHLAPSTLPDADCIVNPNQPGCQFPSKNMAGCGVVFYIMAGLRETLKGRGILPASACSASELLDYVAIGTIADVVKLDENNRLLARLGLERIRQGRAHPGVAALFSVARRSMPRATSKDIGFAIGPRINAAGRLDDMSIGIKALLSDDFQEALELALTLDDLNKTRKAIESNMADEAQIELAAWEGPVPAGICIYGKEFHEGVIGIVAGRIKEKEHRPTIVFAPSQEAGYLKGSGRSIPGFHLRDALDVLHKRHLNLLPKFGGHAMAAGMSIPAERFEEFKASFEQVCSELLTEEALARCVLTDGDLPSNEMTINLAEKIATEVWGQGFLEPLFSSRFNVLEQKLINNAHLKLVLEKEGAEFSAMWFFRDKLLGSSCIDAVYTIEAAEFKGDEYVSLQINQAVEC